jgi:predicted transglutaminase-like cysteine proteinase
MLAGSIANSWASEMKLSPFMATRGATSQPVGHFEFCQGHAAECDIRSRRPVRVHLTAERWNELVAVNNHVNTTIKPATDEEMFGRPEVWFYPTTEGDCEDLVLLKRRTLMQKGWPVSALLITVVRQKNGDGHAVLSVLTDRGDLVLDNLDPHILVWSETGYEYVKRQSTVNTGLWVGIDDGRTTEVGSLRN